jgi:hypothetical protein
LELKAGDFILNQSALQTDDLWHKGVLNQTKEFTINTIGALLAQHKGTINTLRGDSKTKISQCSFAKRGRLYLGLKSRHGTHNMRFQATIWTVRFHYKQH